jgi:hypothetical protein
LRRANPDDTAGEMVPDLVAPGRHIFLFLLVLVLNQSVESKRYRRSDFFPFFFFGGDGDHDS